MSSCLSASVPTKGCCGHVGNESVDRSCLSPSLLSLKGLFLIFLTTIHIKKYILNCTYMYRVCLQARTCVCVEREKFKFCEMIPLLLHVIHFDTCDPVFKTLISAN